MRRSGLAIVGIVIVAAAIVGTGYIGYNRGVSAGKTEVSTDRSAFQARGTTVSGAGGAARGPGGAGGPGGQGGAPGQAVAGSSVAGSGGAGGQGGVTGKVTKVENGVITVQGANNTMTTVNTTAATTVQKFAAAKTSDLKMGDFVAMQGDKTGDTAYTAKTLTGLGSTLPGGGAAAAAPGGQGGQGQGQASGGSASGSSGGNGSGASGQAPGGGTGGQSGRAAGGGGFSGFGAGAIIGRITKIDGATLTMQGTDGTSLTITTSDGTTVRTTQAGAVSDISVGDSLIVQGDQAGTALTARVIIDQGAG